MGEAGGAGTALIESQFEKGLLPHLQALTSARRQVNINDLMVGWPRVGRLDIELSGPSRPTWLELKWTKGANELHNCLWDAGKIAQALREAKAHYGFLVAGAPIREWSRGNLASRLFEVSNHQGHSLIADYPSWWSFWASENANTYPLELPTPVITVPVGRVRLPGLGGDPWMVRVARVEAPGDDHYAPARLRPRARAACPPNRFCFPRFSRRVAEKFVCVNVVASQAGRTRGMMNKNRYLIVIEGDGSTNYSSYSPDLPGVAATGATRQECEHEMQQAIAFHIEGLRGDGDPVPEPQSTASYAVVELA